MVLKPKLKWGKKLHPSVVLSNTNLIQDKYWKDKFTLLRGATIFNELFN